jgi:hypothetical protein
MFWLAREHLPRKVFTAYRLGPYFSMKSFNS